MGPMRRPHRGGRGPYRIQRLRAGRAGPRLLQGVTRRARNFYGEVSVGDRIGHAYDLGWRRRSVRGLPSYRGPAPSPVIWPPSACPNPRQSPATGNGSVGEAKVVNFSGRHSPHADESLFKAPQPHCHSVQFLSILRQFLAQVSSLPITSPLNAILDHASFAWGSYED